MNLWIVAHSTIYELILINTLQHIKKKLPCGRSSQLWNVHLQHDCSSNWILRTPKIYSLRLRHWPKCLNVGPQKYTWRFVIGRHYTHHTHHCYEAYQYMRKYLYYNFYFRVFKTLKNLRVPFSECHILTTPKPLALKTIFNFSNETWHICFRVWLIHYNETLV